MKNKLFLVLFAICAFINANTFGQTRKDFAAVIHTDAGHRYKGLLTSTTDEGLTIDIRGHKLFFDADSVEKIKIRSKNALNNNMLVGTLIGLTAGGTVYYLQEKRGNIGPIVLPVIVIGSIVYGAGIGAFFNSFFAVENFDLSTTQYKDIKKRLALYANDDE